MAHEKKRPNQYSVRSQSLVYLLFAADGGGAWGTPSVLPLYSAGGSLGGFFQAASSSFVTWRPPGPQPNDDSTINAAIVAIIKVNALFMLSLVCPCGVPHLKVTRITVAIIIAGCVHCLDRLNSSSMTVAEAEGGNAVIDIRDHAWAVGWFAP